MPDEEQLQTNWDMESNTEAGRRHAYVKIWISGIGGGGDFHNVTDTIFPYLISVEVVLRFGGGVSTAAIELDDRDAQLAVPPKNAGVVIAFGWQDQGPKLLPVPYISAKKKGGRPLPWEASSDIAVFRGVVMAVESSFSRRGGGRRMHIDCDAADLSGPGKNMDMFSMGEGEPPPGKGVVQMIPFASFIQQVAGRHGWSVELSPELMGVTRNNWIQSNESFFGIGNRLAEELSAKFVVTGPNTAAILGTKGGTVFNTGGVALSTIPAIWGSNLISWKIKPYTAPPSYSSTIANFFDIMKGQYDSVLGNVPGATAETSAAKAVTPMTAPNAQVGEQLNSGMSSNIEYERGTGWAIINGEPACQGGNTLMIKGARPGVDGGYVITEAAHLYSRGGGYTTRCTLNNPAAASGAPATGG